MVFLTTSNQRDFASEDGGVLFPALASSLLLMSTTEWTGYDGLVNSEG